MTEQTPITATKKVVPALNITRVQNSEFARTVHVATVPDGTTPDDCLNPAFWAHVAAQMRPYDKIEVREEEGKWYGELLVMRAGTGFAKVQKLFFVELAPVEEKPLEIDGYEIKFNPHKKFRVIRMADKVVVSEGHPTRAVAMQWLATNRLSLAA